MTITIYPHQGAEGEELLKIHCQNDRLVMQEYGFTSKMPESECVAELVRRYGELAGIGNTGQSDKTD